MSVIETRRDSCNLATVLVAVALVLALSGPTALAAVRSALRQRSREQP